MRQGWAVPAGWLAKRSDANGMRSTAVQPSAWRAVAASKSKSGEKSSLSSAAVCMPSAVLPAALTRKNCADCRLPMASR